MTEDFDVELQRRLEALVHAYDAAVLARGRVYAAEGRVTGVRKSRDAIEAAVVGTRPYRVTVTRFEGGGLGVDCECRSFGRASECKHVAALALLLRSGLPAGTKKAAVAPLPPRAKVPPLPAVLAGVYSTEGFLSRVGLYRGRPFASPARPPDRWLPLVDWWKQTRDDDAREAVCAIAPLVERDLAELRAWSPPPSPAPRTAFGDLYDDLAQVYLDLRDDVRVRSHPPGPAGAHPGFVFDYEPRRALFTARERESPLLPTSLSLRFTAPVGERAAVVFDGALSNGSGEAWELFALREVIRAFAAREDPAVVLLERELTKPRWDHLLDELAASVEEARPRERAFCLVPTYREGELLLISYARRRAEGGKPLKWKKEAYGEIYSAPSVSDEELDREVGRVALSCLESATEARISIGTAQAHELLRVVAAHPRLRRSPSRSTDVERDPPAVVVVGELTMSLSSTSEQVSSLTPRFFVGDFEIDPSRLHGKQGGAFRGYVSDERVVSVFVPVLLRRWLSLAERMGSAFAFPSESVPRLASTAQPLLNAGIAALPRAALGDELPADPRPAVRVSWETRGAATVSLLVAVRRGAPLVAAGTGPRLFTFEEEGRRVFVERDAARERATVEELRAWLDVPVIWAGDEGKIEGIADTLALAALLDPPPRGLAIEVKRGDAPNVVPFEATAQTFEVQRQGVWLYLRGEIDAGGAPLTFGEVLEAARRAERWIAAKNGTFIELSEETIRKLQPVAMAADLAPDPDGAGEAGVMVHDAFGALVLDAAETFSAYRGVDLAGYASRLAARQETATPRLQRGELRRYQSAGAQWMLDLAEWAPGCVLADDMGLGKTVQTAALLDARAALGPQLIVAPASVSSNWMSELERFVPGLRATWFNEDREVAPSALTAGDVLVISYGLLQRTSGLFDGVRFATVVVDEAQYVKNIVAARSDAVRSLERAFTVALTGTPLENHLGELFAIVDMAFPGLLGDEERFRQRFRRPIEGQRDVVRLAALNRLLAPFLLRRTRGEVLTELPPREEITERVELSVVERRRYLALRRSCEAMFAARRRGETAAQLKIRILAALTRLRQLACDPRLLEEDYDGPTTKVDRVVELASSIAREGGRALVFSQFTQFLGLIRGALEAAGLRVAYLAGETPTAARRELIERFQEGLYDVFCVSLLAGGTGLNLTRASYVIHTDPWWNPAVEEQATSRAHRMGQREPVTVYRLVSSGTIEEAVVSLHATKRELASAVLEGKGSARGTTTRELLDLLAFGAR